MPRLKTGATLYNAQLGLPDKGRAIKELFDLLGFYQPSHEVLIVYMKPARVNFNK